jgi:protein-disulfide isomerase
MIDHKEKQTGAFSRVSPKVGFFAGIGLMLAVFFIVGFFVLLGMVLKDDGSEKVVVDVNNGGVAGENVDQGNTPPQEINIAPVTEDDWIRGSEDAKISIVEYSDIECPFCIRFHPTMISIVEEYEDDVNWVYRHFPLPSLHPNAPKDAEAAECAGEQGGDEVFWEYLDTIIEMELTGINDLKSAAEEIGLNTSQFNECLDSGKYEGKVNSQVAEAQNAGARGTPYSVIIAGDQKIAIPGALPLDQVRQMIDSLL